MRKTRYTNVLASVAVLMTSGATALASVPKPPETLPPAPTDDTVVMGPVNATDGCLNYYNARDNQGMKECLVDHVIEDHFPNYVSTLKTNNLPTDSMLKHLMMSLPFSLPPHNPLSFDHRLDMGEDGALCILNVRRESAFNDPVDAPTFDVLSNPTMQLDGLGRYIGGSSWEDPDPFAGDVPYFPSMLIAQQTLNVGQRYWTDDPAAQPLGMGCTNIGSNFCANVPSFEYPNRPNTWDDQSIVTEEACVSLLEVESTYINELNDGSSSLVDDYRDNPYVIGCAWYAEPDRIDDAVAWQQLTGESSIDLCTDFQFSGTSQMQRRPSEDILGSGFVYPYFHTEVESCGVDITETPSGNFTCLDVTGSTITASTFEGACNTCILGRGSWMDPYDLDPYTPPGGCFQSVMPRWNTTSRTASADSCEQVSGTYTATYQSGVASWAGYARGDRSSRYLGIPHADPYAGINGWALPGFNAVSGTSFNTDDACRTTTPGIMASAVDGFRAEIVWIPDDQVIDIDEVRDAVELAYNFESMRTIPDSPGVSAQANSAAVVGAYCYVAHSPGELCGPQEWLSENWEKCAPLQDL